VSVLDPLFTSVSDVEEADAVCDQLRLHMLVHLSVVVETRRMIHLQQIGLELLVYQDIEAKEFEAGPVAGMCGSACLVGVGQLWLHTE
jgi:hypothetical protein